MARRRRRCETVTGLSAPLAMLEGITESVTAAAALLLPVAAARRGMYPGTGGSAHVYMYERNFYIYTRMYVHVCRRLATI